MEIDPQFTPETEHEKDDDKFPEADQALFAHEVFEKTVEVDFDDSHGMAMGQTSDDDEDEDE